MHLTVFFRCWRTDLGLAFAGRVLLTCQIASICSCRRITVLLMQRAFGKFRLVVTAKLAGFLTSWGRTSWGASAPNVIHIFCAAARSTRCWCRWEHLLRKGSKVPSFLEPGAAFCTVRGRKELGKARAEVLVKLQKTLLELIRGVY